MDQQTEYSTKFDNIYTSCCAKNLTIVAYGIERVNLYLVSHISNFSTSFNAKYIRKMLINISCIYLCRFIYIHISLISLQVVFTEIQVTANPQDLGLF